MKTIIAFSPINRWGIKMYRSKVSDKYSVVEVGGRYNLRMKEDDTWVQPVWAEDGWSTLQELEQFLNCRDWENATPQAICSENGTGECDFKDAMDMLGFKPTSMNYNNMTPVYERCDIVDGCTYVFRAVYLCNGMIAIDGWKDGERLESNLLPKDTQDISVMIQNVDNLFNSFGICLYASMQLSDVVDREYVTASITTKDLSKNMVRVKSSNVWAYNINVRDPKSGFGDVLVQFKGNKGGPGDIYIYYDVPVRIYRRWHTAPSKGHFFWEHIRNQFNYSKLTGDKRGKLANAIN